MHKDRLAEAILALFTTRERAASTVGDLLESDAAPFSFWTHVVRTAVSLFWRDVRTEPVYMARLALCGMAMMWVNFLCLILMMTAFGMIAILLMKFTPWWSHAGDWLVTADGILFKAAQIPLGFQLGSWIALRARSREIASAFTFAMFGLAASWIILNLIDVFRTGRPLQDPSSTVLSHLLIDLPLLAGAIYTRRKNAAVVPLS
jgi:hypothetical protein